MNRISGSWQRASEHFLPVVHCPFFGKPQLARGRDQAPGVARGYQARPPKVIIGPRNQE